MSEETDERIAVALESIAASLARMTDPVLTNPPRPPTPAPVLASRIVAPMERK